MAVIRILVADDHSVVREGIKRIVSEVPDLVVTAEARDGEEVLERLRAEPFDVVLLDIRAAGILPVFAAGNSGPNADTSESPANYPEALAVGALGEEGAVALFSARGPSAFDGLCTYPGSSLQGRASSRPT